ncbi:MAG: hypothetical protein EOO22_13565 [Comamonadaceae bacterium]|nr:MAG: hypothetical protein EOO22_13565 [Comamonadaceae bacterium]
MFSAEVANVVGPYMAIVIASAIGASFALRRREKASRLSALWFFGRVVGLAVVLTVALAFAASWKWPGLHERVLLAPIALMVGFIGDDWPALLSKIMRGIFSVVDLMRKGEAK